MELIRNEVALESGTVLESSPGIDHEIVPYNHDFAVRQILSNLHPPMQNLDDQNLAQQAVNSMEIDVEDEQQEQDVDTIIEGTSDETAAFGVGSPFSGQKKRKARAKTPIVDDEVRRSLRFKENEARKHIQLDRELRRKKGEIKKIVYFSTIEDLKTAIISRSLDEDLEEAGMIEPIQAVTLVGLGSSFCGVPPEELMLATLNHEDE